MTQNQGRSPRSRTRKPDLQARTLGIVMVVLLFAARPRLAEQVLLGLGVVLAVAAAGLVIYVAGLALGKYKPPARITLGSWSVEFL